MTLTTDTRERTLEFLARTLENPDLAAEQPLLSDARFGGQVLEIEEDGEVRAACTLLPRRFRMGPHTVTGGLIGSVATDPAWRGRGLATRLLERAEDELRARGALFSLLWANDPTFYFSRGYVPFGSECDYMLVSELAGSLPEPSGVRALAPGDEPFLLRLLERHSHRVERNLEEMTALLRTPGMRTLVRVRAAAPSQPALPVAYACLGRGHDLGDAIHDWAGEAEDVLAVARAFLEQRFPEGETGALFLMAPPAASELGYRLVKLGAISRSGILGLGKLLDPEGACALLTNLLGADGSPAAGASDFHLAGPRATGQLDLDALQGLLFGGPEVRAEARALLERLGFVRARLPLEPFAFGLDSI